MITGHRIRSSISADEITFDRWLEKMEVWKKDGVVDRDNAEDYFIYPKEALHPNDFPPLGIGYPAWDNFMVYYSWKKCIELVDATGTLSAVHFNHGLSNHKTNGAKSRHNRNLADHKFGFKRGDGRIDSSAFWKTVRDDKGGIHLVSSKRNPECPLKTYNEIK